ncbi:MAG: TerC family protein [Bacteroidota bacterium]
MTVTNEILLWGGFNLLVLILLSVDLIVFNRKAHEITIKESLIWSAVWITVSLLFNVFVFIRLGHEAALQFFTGYIIEKSLSVDNLFVFLLIFSYFKVSPKYQHKVLFWGILGALVMRGVLIFLGAALIERFEWVLYVFGALLVYTGVKMAFQKEQAQVHPERNIVVRFFKRFLPVTPGYHEERFFIRINHKNYATLLFVVLIVIETTDLVFALDSIPAIFAITTDTFIVYTSNVFAILGLRSLYFALAGMMDLFYYLRHGLSVVLSFIGLKMLLAEFIHFPITIALAVVASVLMVSILASIIRAKRHKILVDQGSK